MNTIMNKNQLMCITYLLGGTSTYDFFEVGSTFTWNGAQRNPIRISAFPGDNVGITSTNSARNILQVSGQYWIFEGTQDDLKFFRM